MSKRYQIEYRDPENELTAAALNGLDCDRVRRAMLAVDHKWMIPGGADYRVPEVHEIQRTAEWIIEHTLDSCRALRLNETPAALYQGGIGGLLVLVHYENGAITPDKLEILYTI